MIDKPLIFINYQNNHFFFYLSIKSQSTKYLSHLFVYDNWDNNWIVIYHDALLTTRNNEVQLITSQKTKFLRTKSHFSRSRTERFRHLQQQLQLCQYCTAVSLRYRKNSKNKIKIKEISVPSPSSIKTIEKRCRRTWKRRIVWFSYWSPLKLRQLHLNIQKIKKSR